jgi:hypothetical protein
MSRMSGIYHETTLGSGLTAITAASVEKQNITVPGAKPGDFVFVSIDGFDSDDCVYSATVSAANQVTLSIFADATGGSNIASAPIRIKVVPFDAI